MLHILSVRTEMPLTAIQTALRHVRKRKITLVFPLGKRPAIASASAMQALAAFCGQLGKEIAMIGGDELLRALAVAAGFVSATSLEEGVVKEDAPPTARRSDADEWERADARFRADQKACVTGPLGLDELDDDTILTLLDEPPDYLQPLLEQRGGDDGTTWQEVSGRSMRPLRRSGRTTRKLAATEEEEALRFIYETDEDEITTAIRATGGGSRPAGEGVLTLLPWNRGGSETVGTGSS
jgi:hypothetical protein